MPPKYTDDFRRDAVRMAMTSGLTRPQLASDLGVGVSTLNIERVCANGSSECAKGPETST